MKKSIQVGHLGKKETVGEIYSTHGPFPSLRVCDHGWRMGYILIADEEAIKRAEDTLPV